MQLEQQNAASQSEESFQPLQQLLKDDIATVRKDDVFASEVTKEEQDIIRQRVDHQRKALQEYERRMRSGKIKKIHQIHPYVTEEEAIQTLIECNEDEVFACHSSDFDPARKKLLYSSLTGSTCKMLEKRLLRNMKKQSQFLTCQQ